MDFQDKGITQDYVANVVENNTPETPKNDYICPLCSKQVVDRRVNGECQVSHKGNNLPAYQCIDNDDFKNPTCKGVIWDYPIADLKIEKPSHQNDIVELDENNKEVVDNELPLVLK